jgi:MFS family permease
MGPTRRQVPFDFPGFLLVGLGMVALVFGMDALGGSNLPGWIVATELILAVAILAAATIHFLVAPQPLLDIRLLRIRTFRVSFLTGGGIDTVTLTAVLFVLPLMFQVGFGMTAVQSGSLTFAAAAGSLLIRIAIPSLLRRFGFRNVLVFNTPVVAAIAAGFAFFHAGLPAWIAVAYIFAFGMFRAIQWSSTGNLAYSDIKQEKLAHFSALYYILWQLGVAIGIGLASALLSFLSRHRPHASVDDFRIVFVVEGVATLLALFGYLSLKSDDGVHVSGRRIRGAMPD